MGENRSSFQALLTSGRPKQTDSSWFCSHTVQAPAKPESFAQPQHGFETPDRPSCRAALLLAEIARLRPRQIGFDLPLLATVRYARRRPRAEEARHAAD